MAKRDADEFVSWWIFCVVNEKMMKYNVFEIIRSWLEISKILHKGLVLNEML